MMIRDSMELPMLLRLEDPLIIVIFVVNCCHVAVNCLVTVWAAWSSCSGTCGIGSRVLALSFRIKCNGCWWGVGCGLGSKTYGLLPVVKFKVPLFKVIRNSSLLLSRIDSSSYSNDSTR